VAWWLERRLPVLAEHAADDAALAVSFDTQAYARLLLDSAARLDNAGSRLIWHSAAMSGPIVAQRIRRVLNVRTVERLKPLGTIGRASLLALGAALIWISTAVDVPRLVAGQTNRAGSVDEFTGLISAERAAALEQELAANPEDETTRGTLLGYYMSNKMSDRRVPLILWLIDHHPESDLAEMAVLFPALDGSNVYQDARNRWLTQVNLHPNDARVLVNAARAGLFDSPREQIDLLKRARSLDPARGTEPLARLYSGILMWDKEPGLAAQVRNELQSSNDIAMVGSVARHVVEGGVSRLSASDRYALAAELVTHAQTLEPQNRAWSDLFEEVKQMPAFAAACQGLPVCVVAQEVPAGVAAVRVGGPVAAYNLQESRPPIYPPLAKAASVQGTVKLQIRIGADGHVKEATAISGHPLLIVAAVDAAKRYVYKPTLVNGQPAEVLTGVQIVFRLPAQ